MSLGRSDRHVCRWFIMFGRRLWFLASDAFFFGWEFGFCFGRWISRFSLWILGLYDTLMSLVTIIVDVYNTLVNDV